MGRKEAGVLRMETTTRVQRPKSRSTFLPGRRSMGFSRACLPIGRAPELAEVEGGAHQGPLAPDLADPSEQELAKPPSVLDLSENRLGGEHPQAVHGVSAKRPQASVHPLPPGQIPPPHA